MLTVLLTMLENDEDKNLLIEIYDKNAKALNLVARENLINRENTDDCIQETFLELIKSFENFKCVPEKSRKAYLLTICRRTAYKMNNKDYGAIPSDDSDIDSFACQPEPDFSDFDRVHLAITLNKIDLKYREPLIMKYADGYTSKEIAEKLGITQNLVSQRIFRGKKLLYALLKEE